MISARIHRAWRGSVLAVVLFSLSCARERAGSSAQSPLVVFTAGSLSRPMRAALDSFAAHEHATYELESAGSLETARKLTELKKIPDILALADEDVFPKFLMPAYVHWYARFARNRLVIAYTDRSKGANRMTANGWFAVLQEPGVQVGRSNPDLDPAGYRTLMVFQLAERLYNRPGLARALETAAPAKLMRPKEIELVALLEAGELDYAWFYESMARAAGLRYLTLPEAIDLSSQADSANYATASVRVRGATPSDTLELRGAPIRYAFSIPDAAPHATLAGRFAQFLLSPAGRAALESAFLPTLPVPEMVGTGAPAAVTAQLHPPVQ